MQQLINKRVYFDVNIFIYAVEPTEEMQRYFSVVQKLFELAVSKQIQAITSELSLAEALVGAYKNNQHLISLYEEMITDRKELIVLPVNRTILKNAALFRSRQKIALADAIHVATALTAKTDFLITQDKRLKLPEGLAKKTLDDFI